MARFPTWPASPPLYVPFVTYVHRRVTDGRLFQMWEAFSGGGKLADFVSIYKEMDRLLVSKDRIERAGAKASCVSYPSNESQPKVLSPEVAVTLLRFISVTSCIEGSDNQPH